MYLYVYILMPAKKDHIFSLVNLDNLSLGSKVRDWYICNCVYMYVSLLVRVCAYACKPAGEGMCICM